MPLVKECLKCKYFHKETKTGTTGACRRYPPQIMLEIGDCWPEVDEVGWCGEHEFKDQKERLT